MTIRILIIIILSGYILTGCGEKGPWVEVYDQQERLRERYRVDPQDSLKHGPYYSFHEDGDIYVSGNYRAGKLDGPHTLFHPNGQIERKETYIDGDIDGTLVSYYDNGQVEQTGKYIDGKMEGIWKRFYRNGQLMEEVLFNRNNENGPFIEYYENGNLKARGTYKNGDYEHGLLELFDENGTLERKMQCDMGICQTIWTPDSL